MSRPLKLLLAAVALGLAASPLPARAWLFSADVLVHKVGVARRNLKADAAKLSALSVQGTLKLSGDEARAAASILGIAFDPQAPELALPATASYKIPGRCRIEAAGGTAGVRLSAVNGNGAVALEGEGRQLAVLEMFADIACPLLDGRGGYDGPLALVKRAGIRRSLVTLGRAEGQHIAYVVGAAPTRADASSLWVSKETFQPLRFVDRRAPLPREVRFIDYDSPEAGRWHPRRIEFFQAGRLIGSFSLEAAVPNPKLSSALF